MVKLERYARTDGDGESREPRPTRREVGSADAALRNLLLTISAGSEILIDLDLRPLFTALGIAFEAREPHASWMWDGNTINANLPDRHLQEKATLGKDDKGLPRKDAPASRRTHYILGPIGRAPSHSKRALQ